MWLFHFCMNKSASAVLNTRLSADGRIKKLSPESSGKKRYFTTSPQAVNFLLKKYGTGEVIAETQFHITGLTNPSNMTPFQFAEELVKITLVWKRI